MKLYSKGVRLIFRIIALGMAVAMLVANIWIFVTKGFPNMEDFKINVSVIVNTVFIFGFVAAFFFPSKLEIFSLLAFLYSANVFILEPKSLIGVPMYFLGAATLYVRGFFKKSPKIKVSVTIAVYLLLILSEVRFGWEVFVDLFLEKMGYTFVLGAITFFLQIRSFDLIELEKNEKKLDLGKYPELNARDAEWLRMIQKNEKYTSIAVDYKMAIGSVKNRIKFIFDTIGVGDKQCFLEDYGDCEIVYAESASKDKKIRKLGQKSASDHENEQMSPSQS